VGEDLGSMPKRSFWGSQSCEIKKNSGIFSGYKRFTVEGYFWVFNLLESKNSFRVDLGSKDFIGV